MTPAFFLLAQTRVDSVLQRSWELPTSVTLALVALAAALVVWLYRTERGEAGATARWLLAAIRLSLLAGA